MSNTSDDQGMTGRSMGVNISTLFGQTQTIPPQTQVTSSTDIGTGQPSRPPRVGSVQTGLSGLILEPSMDVIDQDVIRYGDVHFSSVETVPTLNANLNNLINELYPHGEGQGTLVADDTRGESSNAGGNAEEAELPEAEEPEMTVLARDEAALPRARNASVVYAPFFNLPPPENIIADPPVAASIRSSNFFEQLPLADRSVLTSIGPMEITGASGTVLLTPFVQLMFQMIGRYYAFMSPVGYSEAAARLIHYVYYSTCQATGGIDTHGIQDGYTTVTSYGWESFIPVLARLLYSNEMLSSTDLTSILTPTVLQTSLINLQNTYYEAHRLYVVLAYLCAEGEPAIGPLPEWLCVDGCIQRYVDGIATGTLRASQLGYEIRPRPANLRPLPFTPFDAGRAAPTEANVVVNRPIVVQEPVVSVFPRRGARTQVSEAIQQIGDPGRVQIVRNTDSFRESTEHLLSYENRIVELSTMVREQGQILNRLLQLQEQSAERNSRLEESLLLLTAQSSRTDMMARQNLNQTLLTTDPSPEAVRLIQAAPVQTPITTNVVAGLINEMNNIDRNPGNVGGLLIRLRAELTAHGQNAYASDINERIILDERKRKRIIGVLSSLSG
jgi:hypothetical protein